ncbi:MAG: hypothetical protein KF812_06755 [Fimbriimonadaceae bacterium]|nr:hypothetical protein [Fimbriimonadaceae bacterium]
MMSSSYRSGFALFATLISSSLLAQAADFVLIAELRPTINSGDDGDELRWFDQNATASIVGIRLLLINGSRVKLTQRITRLPGDGDPGYIDEAYIERRGVWRAGRQWIPFGRGAIVHETMTGVRFDTRLVFGNEAAAVAFDNGVGRSRGVALRAGDAIGFSVASGNHLGIGPATLTEIDGVTGGFGRGGGYRLLLGGDAQFVFAGLNWQGEHVVFLDPERASDSSFSASNLSFTVGLPISGWKTRLSWSRRWDRESDQFGVSIDAPAEAGIVYRGYLGLRSGTIFRGGFGVTIKF